MPAGVVFGRCAAHPEIGPRTYLPFVHIDRRVPLQFLFDKFQLWDRDGQHGQVHDHEQYEQYKINVNERRVLPRPPRPDGLGADNVQT